MEVWKFQVSPNPYVQMPKGADTLSVGIQGQDIMVWARVNPNSIMITRRLPVYGTGHVIDPLDHELPLIGTVFMGPLVFHVFDGGEVGEK